MRVRRPGCLIGAGTHYAPLLRCAEARAVSGRCHVAGGRFAGGSRLPRLSAAPSSRAQPMLELPQAQLEVLELPPGGEAQVAESALQRGVGLLHGRPGLVAAAGNQPVDHVAAFFAAQLAAAHELFDQFLHPVLGEGRSPHPDQERPFDQVADTLTTAQPQHPPSWDVRPAS